MRITRSKNPRQPLRVRWNNFKERSPRIARAAIGFLPSLYYQIPIIGSFLAVRPEFLTYFNISKQQLPNNLWLYLSVGTAALIPLAHIAKRITKRMFRRENGTMDGRDKFVTALIMANAPAYISETLVNKLVTNNFTNNHLLYLPAHFITGVTTAYLCFTAIWGGIYNKAFKKMEKSPLEKISLLNRLKIYLAMGINQNIPGILLEKFAPNSKIVKRMKELTSKAEERQLVEKTTLSEDVVTLFGISKGGDLHLLPIEVAIMGGVLACGLGGPDAFATYFVISQPLRWANGLWKNASGIGLYMPTIEQKEDLLVSSSVC